MRLAIALKKASLVGAFFISALVSGPLLALCEGSGALESVSVAQVVDGDTLRLTDGRNVRLIGLNTPERGRNGMPDEPWANAAKDRLQQLVEANGRRVGLRLGQQPRDHYGRYLAHAFGRDGNNLEAQLLAEGMGYFVAIAPNVSLASCHLDAERVARRKGLGVWRDAPIVAATALRKGGFAIVQARVERVERNRGGVWLELEGPLVVHVEHRDARAFGEIATLAGQLIEARGWVVDRQGRQRDAKSARWKLKVSHPSMLQALH